MCRNAADAKAEPLLYTTAAHDRSSKGSSSLQASAALCKGIIGTGIFALPPAIRAAGWVLGTGMAIACGLVSLYTMVNVMACIRELRRRGVAADNDGRIEYNDVFERSGLLSRRVNGLVTVLCVGGQLGSVLSFYAFVINNVLSLLPSGWGAERWHVSAVMTLFTGPLCLLRTPKSAPNRIRSARAAWSTHACAPPGAAQAARRTRRLARRWPLATWPSLPRWASSCTAG